MAVKTKEDLREYMEQDSQRYHEKKGLLQRLLYPQNSNLKYLKCLRKAEYYCNFAGGGGILKVRLSEAAASSGSADGH